MDDPGTCLCFTQTVILQFDAHVRLCFMHIKGKNMDAKNLLQQNFSTETTLNDAVAPVMVQPIVGSIPHTLMFI